MHIISSPTLQAGMSVQYGGFQRLDSVFQNWQRFQSFFQCTLIATVAQGIRGTPRYLDHDEGSVGTP